MERDDLGLGWEARRRRREDIMQKYPSETAKARTFGHQD